jgi:hypothetical protein
MVFAADILFELANFLREEFNRATAVGANHVVMAPPVVLVFVAGDAIMKGDLAGQAAFREQFQGSVYGGVADVGIFFLNQAVQFVGGKVVPSLKESAQNRVALGSLLQADPLQVLMKEILSFTNHLPGDGGLVIDTRLEHGEPGSSQVQQVRIPPAILKMKFIFIRVGRIAWHNQDSS